MDERPQDDRLRLYLFTTDAEMALQAQECGISSIIVDWENKGKAQRQRGYDTEINSDTVGDLASLSKILQIPVTVRINPVGPHTEAEVEKALDHGAREIMLPMAESPTEVEHFLTLVRGRCDTMIQVERVKLLCQLKALSILNWDRAHIGLNDLMVDRGGRSLWEPFLDGTIDHIFSSLRRRSVGLAGATIVSGGHPIPFTLLMGEMARLGCQFTFLRRSFKREVVGRRMNYELPAINVTWEAALHRSREAVASDQLAFREKLLDLLRAESRVHFRTG